MSIGMNAAQTVRHLVSKIQIKCVTWPVSRSVSVIKVLSGEKMVTVFRKNHVQNAVVKIKFLIIAEVTVKLRVKLLMKILSVQCNALQSVSVKLVLFEMTKAGSVSPLINVQIFKNVVKMKNLSSAQWNVVHRLE